jgi:hypothetical protein
MESRRRRPGKRSLAGPFPYQPQRRPWFCSRSQLSKGRIYSIIGSAVISLLAVKVRIA